MLIVGNWKAYVEDAGKAKKLFALAKRLASGNQVSIVLAPSAPFLGLLTPKNRSKVAFAAQDISAMTGGAHTGEISAQAYAAMGATYVIIGHSERREGGETDEIVARKLEHALAHGLTPILCVGERQRDPEGKYLAFVRGQIERSLAALSPKERSKVIVAYEPLWAIGKTSEEAIAPTELSEMALYLRKVLAELLPGKSAARAKILYGGSVDPENARALAGGGSIDGFLVARASVESERFSALVKALA